MNFLTLITPAGAIAEALHVARAADAKTRPVAEPASAKRDGFNLSALTFWTARSA